jgi:signal transduction histidine kinase
MARVGGEALELERAEARLKHQSAIEENIQLALWRMDSALAPMIMEEAMRPYFTYSAFYPAERAYTHMFEVIQKGDVLVASPLLTHRSPHVLLHFQFGPVNQLGSPQVPQETLRSLAEPYIQAPNSLAEASKRLEELRRLVTPEEMLFVCSTDATASARHWMTRLSALVESRADAVRGSKELAMRFLTTTKARESKLDGPQTLPAVDSVSHGSMNAAWIDDVLLLGREVRVGGKTFLQGCWLDWDSIRTELLESVADLIPNAALEPISPDDVQPTRQLAALPAKLVVRQATSPLFLSSSPSPVQRSLWIAWGCLAIAVGATALLLWGALAMSERRGTFVSAVTHELRTPLTTFRIYTEMLANGMVAEPEVRGRYLETLRSQADRLGRLVENVLRYSRVERNRKIACPELVSTHELIERVKPTLDTQAGQAGFELQICRSLPDTHLKTDTSVVEQILVNLVDNAAKFASSTDSRRVHLDVVASGAWLEVSIRDHGPGLSKSALRTLFRPFSRRAEDAVNAAPGVGLGLALSKRLAGAIGGKLRLDHSGSDGATFTLALPALTSASPNPVMRGRSVAIETPTDFRDQLESTGCGLKDLPS